MMMLSFVIRRRESRKPRRDSLMIPCVTTFIEDFSTSLFGNLARRLVDNGRKHLFMKLEVMKYLIDDVVCTVMEFIAPSGLLLASRTTTGKSL